MKLLQRFVAKPWEKVKIKNRDYMQDIREAGTEKIIPYIINDSPTKRSLVKRNSYI